MNNFEIIVNDAINGGFIALETVEEKLANGEDIGFHTFKTWKKMGYIVKRGSKALFMSRIWDPKYYNKLKEYREKGGKEEEAPHMWKTNAYLFSHEQVEKLSEVNSKVKMAKGEVSETRKVETVEPKKAKKNTRKAKKVATKKVTTKKAEPKKSARELYESMEIGKPITVKYEKKTRKTETRKAEKPVQKIAKKVNSQKGKYNQEFYIMTRKDNDVVAEKVMGFELENSKCKGLFCHKKGTGKDTRYSISDIDTGCLVKSGNKLKDLLASVESDEFVEAIKNARALESYPKNVQRLQNAIANA